MVKSPPLPVLICINVSLKLKIGTNNLPLFSKFLLKFNIFLKGDACDVTKFYAMLIFCINLTGNKLFKIVFLFKTTFIFPQLYLSREVCMIYPDLYWLSTYPYPLWACPPLCGLGAWDFLSMAIKN